LGYNGTLIVKRNNQSMGRGGVRGERGRGEYKSIREKRSSERTGRQFSKGNIPRGLKSVAVDKSADYPRRKQLATEP
jgi:hypothetical protein